MPSAEHEQTPIETRAFLRPREIQELNAELSHLKNSLQHSQMPGTQISGRQANIIREGIKKLEKRLENTPPDHLPGPVKDRIHARIGALEQKIQEGMPTDMEMRRNPTGAVDKHMRWERRNKKAILEWKNLQLALHGSKIPIEESSALCNVERLRPFGGSGELDATHSQIQGKDFYDMSQTWNSDHPKAACWDEIFGDPSDPRVQALVSEVNEQREARAALEEEMDRMRREIAEHRAREEKNGRG